MSDQMVVWKHHLAREANSLRLTVGAEVLHVAEQQGQVQLWERHDPEQAATEIRRFRVVGTGHEVPSPGRHVGSLVTSGGTFVFHVFEDDA